MNYIFALSNPSLKIPTRSSTSRKSPDDARNLFSKIRPTRGRCRRSADDPETHSPFRYHWTPFQSTEQRRSCQRPPELSFCREGSACQKPKANRLESSCERSRRSSPNC